MGTRGLATVGAVTAGLASVAAPASDADAGVSPARVYRASLAYAQCLRREGVPHPDPDAAGNFHLTAADERRLREVPAAKRRAAMADCFRRHLKGVIDTKPLSPAAKARARAVLAEVRDCVRGFGYRLGKPVVENLTLGRAFFGFTASPSPPRTARLRRAEHTCEQRVHLAQRLDAIIAADRGPY